MLVLVDAGRVDAEEGVGEPAWERGITEVGVDYEDGEEGEQDAIPETVEADVGVERPDDAVGVGVEEGEVLLEDLRRC